MKYETAIKNAREIAARIKKVNGLIGTPGCEYDVFKIRRAWLFGSTAKGKSNPGDVDILIEGHAVGRRLFAGCRANRGVPWSNALADKEFKRRYGISVSKSSKMNAVLFLTKNMKMIRVHDYSVDGEIAYPRIMLYPRIDLPTQPQARRKTNG